eukprot:superscaffoldBa00006425_g21521
MTPLSPEHKAAAHSTHTHHRRRRPVIFVNAKSTFFKFSHLQRLKLRLHCKRNKLVRELEEMVRLATSLHTQLKSLSTSTLSCSSGSSRGSLTSSHCSLATTSSLGSTSSLSFTDIYLEQPELADPDFQNKLDSLLQEGGQGGYRPSSSITTIHEHEVVTGCGGGEGRRQA